jgi:DNA-binding response OmpR family regulator
MNRTKYTPPLAQKVYEIDDDLTAPKSILLVEDEAAFAAIVKEYLETFNYSVTIAPDGVQGMKRILEKDFDVIVCDLLMPNLPGDMFYIGVQRLKPKLAGRFIFITGHQSDPKIAEFVKRSRALTLFKPFDMHLLLETIQAALMEKK